MTQVCEKIGVSVRYQKAIAMNRASINWYKSYKRGSCCRLGGRGKRGASTLVTIFRLTRRLRAKGGATGE
jgi:hypothetical protein